jgi:hypothetical protein
MMAHGAPAIGRRDLLGLVITAFVVPIASQPASAQTTDEASVPIEHLDDALLATMKAECSSYHEDRWVGRRSRNEGSHEQGPFPRVVSPAAGGIAPEQLFRAMPSAAGITQPGGRKQGEIRDSMRSLFWSDTVQHQANCSDIQQCF